MQHNYDREGSQILATRLGHLHIWTWGCKETGYGAGIGYFPLCSLRHVTPSMAPSISSLHSRSDGFPAHPLVYPGPSEENSKGQVGVSPGIDWERVKCLLGAAAGVFKGAALGASLPGSDPSSTTFWLSDY
jgi:hypothetical protein